MAVSFIGGGNGVRW